LPTFDLQQWPIESILNFKKQYSC